MIKELVHDPIFLTLKSVWAFLAGSGKVAPVFPDLLRGQVTDKCPGSSSGLAAGAALTLYALIMTENI